MSVFVTEPTSDHILEFKPLGKLLQLAAHAGCTPPSHARKMHNQIACVI
jgi:hypothetical protein